MKKLLIFLLILSFVCVLAVSCGADAAPGETKTDVTSACGLTTEAADTTKSYATDATKAPVSVETPASSAATTTQTSATIQKPVSTTRDPEEGWGDLIPIT